MPALPRWPSPLDAVEAASVTPIAAEVFAALVDRQTGLLTSWPGAPVSVADPLNAWVDLFTEPASRDQRPPVPAPPAT